MIHSTLKHSLSLPLALTLDIVLPGFKRRDTLTRITSGRSTVMRYRLEYMLLVALAAVVRRLPRNAALALGRRVGAISRYLQPMRARVAEDNLRHAFPDMSSQKRDSIVNRVFCDMGVGFVEMMRLDLFSGKPDLIKYFLIEGEEHLREAHAMGKGGIILTGHVGFWEAGNFVFPTLGFQIGIVAKPMRNPLVDGYFRRMRESYGAYVIDSRKGARRIVRALRSNHLVGILMDQHMVRSQAVRVPFFGRPAYTTPVIAEIAKKYQVPVIPVFGYRNLDNTYRVRIAPPLILDRDLSEEGILAGTTLLTKTIEQGIMYDVAQWFWIHRRWKHVTDHDL
jgi:KDO2-lipid IV(A) lauroyltransferase